MTKFRLKMAGQLGEKVAAEAGFTKFPIIPIQIAEANAIIVEAKPPDTKGVSGALIFAGNDVTLLYSTEYNNRGFENFSISHELGHYFIPGHPEEIIAQGGAHLSRANFTENSSIELEADHFASGLLLPTSLTRRFLSNHQTGLEGILALADAAECSRTAAAIRSAQCSPYPVAVIVSQGDKVAYAFLSDRFKSVSGPAFLKKGTPLPACATRDFNADPENVRHARQACGRSDVRTCSMERSRLNWTKRSSGWEATDSP